MTPASGGRRAWPARLAYLAVLLAGARAAAWDAGTTQAGLTEQAALASKLHRVLVRDLGRSLGLFEPVRLSLDGARVAADAILARRLSALDPGHGHRPDPDGTAPALAWLSAGAVLSETPAARGRHHFLEPETRAGLRDGVGLIAFAQRVRAAADGGGLRDVATGSAFDLSGMSSLEWLRARENDQSLPVFWDRLEDAAAAPTPVERDAALGRALLALGGVLAVLQDAGEPAHVRNDFRGAFDRRLRGAGYRGNAFERFVAQRYGRAGVPGVAAAVARDTVEDFFVATDGEGLAQRTQRRFFSDGTVPAPVPVTPRSTIRDVLVAARASLPFAAPNVDHLRLDPTGRVGYLKAEGRRVLAYRRDPEEVVFFLDDAVYGDAAAALLPEVGAYAAGLVDHLLRARLIVGVAGRAATVELDGARELRSGTLRVLAEDATGRRRVIHETKIGPAIATEIAVPAGARRIVAALRGEDAAGELVALGEALVR